MEHLSKVLIQLKYEELKQPAVNMQFLTLNFSKKRATTHHQI